MIVKNVWPPIFKGNVQLSPCNLFPNILSEKHMEEYRTSETESTRRSGYSVSHAGYVTLNETACLLVQTFIQLSESGFAVLSAACTLQNLEGA